MFILWHRWKVLIRLLNRLMWVSTLSLILISHKLAIFIHIVQWILLYLIVDKILIRIFIIVRLLCILMYKIAVLKRISNILMSDLKMIFFFFFVHFLISSILMYFFFHLVDRWVFNFAFVIFKLSFFQFLDILGFKFQIFCSVIFLFLIICRDFFNCIFNTLIFFVRRILLQFKPWRCLDDISINIFWIMN